MTNRERLSSLIKQAEQREQLDFITADIDEAIDMSGGTKISCSMEYLADYLLANGVIVLPCKVGDTVYQIDAERVFKSKIKAFVYDTENFAFDERAIGKSVFLTREEAEKALKECVQ